MYKTKIFLKYAVCEEKYFTLAFLSRRLSDLFNRLPSDGKPNLLTLYHLMSADNKLKQTANQMWILSHIHTHKHTTDPTDQTKIGPKYYTLVPTPCLGRY